MGSDNATKATESWPKGALVFAAALTLATQSHASTIVGGYTVIDTFNFIDARAPNLSGFAAGVFDAIGLDVTPVGSQPTTATDGTTVIATQGGRTVSVPYLYSPVLPNQFFGRASGNLRTTPWTLSLSNPAVNGGAVATVQTAPLATTVAPAFINSIAVVQNGATPILNWSTPSGSTANSQTVYVFDQSVITPVGAALVYTSQQLSASASSFTIPANTLAANHNYVFSIQEDQRDSSGQLLARSRSFTAPYANSQTVPPGTTVQLPTVTISGNSPVYNFNFPVEPNQTYYLDPTLSNAFLYQVGAGDPLFASVDVLPFASASALTLCLPSAGSFACNIALSPGQTYNFAGLGVSSFELLFGGAGFDASNGLPFITALTFASAGSFTGSIAPIANPVPTPEPASIAMLGFGLAGLASFRRRQRR